MKRRQIFVECGGDSVEKRGVFNHFMPLKILRLFKLFFSLLKLVFIEIVFSVNVCFFSDGTFIFIHIMKN